METILTALEKINSIDKIKNLPSVEVYESNRDGYSVSLFLHVDDLGEIFVCLSEYPNGTKELTTRYKKFLLTDTLLISKIKTTLLEIKNKLSIIEDEKLNNI